MAKMVFCKYLKQLLKLKKAKNTPPRANITALCIHAIHISIQQFIFQVLVLLKTEYSGKMIVFKAYQIVCM